MHLSTDKIEYQLNDIKIFGRVLIMSRKNQKVIMISCSKFQRQLHAVCLLSPNIAELHLSNCPSLASSFCQLLRNIKHLIWTR